MPRAVSAVSALFALSVATFLFAGSAHAQRTGPHRAGADHVLEAEIGFYNETDPDLTLVSPLFNASFLVSGNVSLDGTLGFTHVSTDENSETSFGNPFIGVSFLQDLSLFTLRFGVGITPPIADDVLATSLGGASSAGIRGLWNLWLWEPHFFGIIVPASFELSAGPLILGGDAGLGLMIFTGDDDDDVTFAGEGDTELVTQAAGTAGVQLGMVALGARLQVVWLATSDAEDDAQLALEPFVRLDAAQLYAIAKLTLNLDEPLGFAFDEDGVWGFHVGGGVRF